MIWRWLKWLAFFLFAVLAGHLKTFGIFAAAAFAAFVLGALTIEHWLTRRRRLPIIKPGIGFVRPRNGK